MVASLKKLSKTAYQSYTEQRRTEWILQQPAQLVLTVSQVHWCQEVEHHIESPEQDALEQFYQVQYEDPDVRDPVIFAG